MMNEISAKVRAAGVVGGGGAGFPTHVKLEAKAEIFIVNGAECEPLLRVDQQLMAQRAEELMERTAEEDAFRKKYEERERYNLTAVNDAHSAFGHDGLHAVAGAGSIRSM